LIGPLGFAIRNLRRRGFHALLAGLGLTITVSSTTFLLLLGLNLATRLGIDFSGRATFGIAWIFVSYLFLSLALVLIVGMVSTSYLVRSMINQRMKDIAVIKAAGCLPGRLQSYALAESLVVIVSSCLVGGVIAVFTYFSWSGSLIFSAFGPIRDSAVLVLIIPGASFLLSYLIARIHLGKIIQTSTTIALSSQMSSMDLRSLGRPLRIKRFGSAFNLATRTASRDKQFTRTLTRVSICLFLTMVVLTGVFVSSSTTRSYIERAMPSQVLIVANNNIYSEYTKLGLAFSNTDPVPPLDYLNQSYSISSQLASAFASVQGVQVVDSRLIVMTSITGYVKAHFASDQGSGETFNNQTIPEVITGSTQALIVGIDPAHTLGDWYTSDGFLQTSDPSNTIVAGDSLIGSIVLQPLNLAQIGTFGARFNVKSALIDPLNRGRVLYTTDQSLKSVLGVNGFNLLLLKASADPTTISKINGLAAANGLVVGQQDTILNANLAFMDNLWSYLFILPILTLALTGGILLSYLTTNFSKRFNDYVVLKVLGARGWYQLKLLLWESSGLLALCMTFAVPLAWLVSIFLILPEPNVLTENLALPVIMCASVLAAICVVSATIYSRRLRRMTVKDLRP
jgi:ABC-type antimicrobial peptide transport system permease subunit